MAIAGRVAPIPKGEWNSSKEYSKLDIVSHNNKTFIAKKLSTGQEPIEDNQYWMVIVNTKSSPLLIDDDGYVSVDYAKM